MRLACVQFAPTFADLDANTDRIVADIERIDADVIVFPELATSGYFHIGPHEVARIAEPLDGPHISRIVSAAESASKVVVCGFAEVHQGTFFNSSVIAGKGLAQPQVYRKTHLFYKETLGFAPGDTGFFVIHLEHLDCHLGMMICYDWRFPESARTLALKGADVVVCPSNLITHIWRMAMPVRALENKVYLAVANRTGAEHNNNEDVSFNGQSAIYSFNGSVLADAPEHGDAVIITEILPHETRIKSFNSINDIIKDRREERYW
ncbi:MAG: carbon-nitrogen hydrolase [Candidatus Kapabacteria bacterium]|nr:carbon-nitrogen hydrolase [Candidatus Kapabacteria bacterium]